MKKRNHFRKKNIGSEEITDAQDSMPGLRTKRRLAWLKGGHACGLVQEDDASETVSLGKSYMLKWAFKLMLNAIGEF